MHFYMEVMIIIGRVLVFVLGQSISLYFWGGISIHFYMEVLGGPEPAL